MSSVIHCPADCECEWSFLHSYIVTESIAIKDGVMTGTRRTFIVCEEEPCHHWTGNKTCAHHCHEEAEGSAMDVVEIDYGMVNCP